jgi:uncharacterized protein
MAFVLSGCSGLFYQPTPYLYAHPKAKGTQFEDIWFTQGDGLNLHAWHLKRDLKKFPKSKGLLLFFHGNAQNLSSHFLQLNWLTKFGYEVFIFDYRGYGLSDGSPNQAGVNRDSLAALNYAYKLVQKDQHPKFIVYTQSLGGTIGMRAIQEWEQKQKIDLLVLDSTFMSYRGQVQNIMKSTMLLWPFLPFSYFLFSDEYTAKPAMERLKMPVLVIHGMKDPVVIYKNGEEIFSALKTKKWFWKIEDGYHIDVFFRHQKKYRKDFLDFLKKEL